jgi:hypothetical protein
MSYIIDIDKIDKTPHAYDSVLKKDGETIGTQCVALVQQGPAAAGSSNPPGTKTWRPGIQVHGALQGSITKGTVIATFINGMYPTTSPRHAAVYLSHDDTGIRVIDQWVGKAVPSDSRPLTFHALPEDRALDERDVNNGELYYVVELTAAPVVGSTGVEQQTLAH